MAPTGTTLPPGFRFHPTDEELVSYYLERKITGRSIELHIIPEVDLYKHEPWDLPEKSLLPSKDMEWYFYSPTDRKYPNGSRTNRATRAGYWKATGKDRYVTSHQKRSAVGVKKTLVYYRGRAPHGIRTNWIMHEYRLVDSQALYVFPSLKDSYSLCRVFKRMIQTSESPNKEDKTTEAKKKLVGPEEEEGHKVVNYHQYAIKVRNYDASCSDLTQGTQTETGMVDDFQVQFACDEANSAANNKYSLGIMENSLNLFQNIQAPIYGSMHDEVAADTVPLEHLEMEGLPQMNSLETKPSLTKPEIISSQCVLYDKYKDCTFGTLEEIVSLCSSQDIHNFN